MTLAIDHELEQGAVHVYNLGADETIVVDQSIATITAHLGVAPELEYGAAPAAGSATARSSTSTARASARSAGARR
jgi:hypothetical protein